MLINSFDVYDTLITRNVNEPKDIFRFIFGVVKNDDEYLELRDRIKYDFPEVRVNAEKKARIKTGKEVTLADIYDELQCFYCLNDIERKKLVDLEIKTEIENALPIEENLVKVKKLRDAGKRVILISDMYLPKGVYNDIFSKVAPVLLNLPLYISCDYGVTKSNGLLYKLVADSEKCGFEEWIHVGDNPISDCNVAELFGIKTQLYKCGIKQKKLSQRDDPEFLWQCSSIASKLDKAAEEIYRTGSFARYIGFKYYGPIIYGFVNWVLDVAKTKDISKLYFVARDGYILKIIADRIIENGGGDIDTFYLYGSRKAWNPATESDKKILVEYLNQELPNDSNEKYAFVDAKGTGRSIDNLANYLGKKINVFYYALLESVGNKNIIPYVYDAEGRLIESLCRAPHGVTEGYKKENNRIVPILAKTAPEFEKERIDDCIEGVINYVHLVEEMNEADYPGYMLADNAMHYCTVTPDSKVAAYFGDILQDNDNADNKYAPALTKDDIFRIEVQRKCEPLEDFYTGHNCQYSYQRLSESDKKWLDKCRNEFITGDIPKKKKNALKIVIYAYGVKGKELYHRVLYSENVNVIAIIDKNYQKFSGQKPAVIGFKDIKKNDYDYIVISLLNSQQAVEAKAMLIAAGIKADKVLTDEEFYKSHDLSYCSNL